MTWTTLQTAMADHGYIASGDLAMALHLSLSLGRPLLLEGAAGVGKTEVARVLAAVKDTQLIRLQCYEGLDAAQAIYEWNYQRQLLAIRAASEDGETGKAVEARIFSDEFLKFTPCFTGSQSSSILIPNRFSGHRDSPDGRNLP